MCTTSGHIIHLMPGDHKYATPEIPIVIVWNGLNHHVPTYSSNESVLLHWKMSLINRHITEATSLFGEIENDLNDQTDFDLCEQFHLLKSTADLSKQMLEKTAGKISNVVNPPTHIGPDPRDIMTSLTRCTTLADHPLPHFKGYMSVTLESVVDVAAAANPKIPLVPEIPKQETPTQLVQSHSAPIPSSRTSNILPPPPKDATKEIVFNFPLGEYLEVKRKSGSSRLKPQNPAPVPDPKPKPKCSSTTNPSLIVNIPLCLLGKAPVSSSAGPPALKMHDSHARPDEKLYDSRSQADSGLASGKEQHRKTCDSRVTTSVPTSSSSAGPASSLPEVLQGLAQAAAQSAIGKSKPSTGKTQSSLGASQLSLGQLSSGKGKSLLRKSKGKGPIKFSCEQPGCIYSTFNKGDFTIHMDKHFGVKYKCSTCKKEFGSTKSRDTHIRTVHLKQHRAQCPEPGCTFSHNDHGVTRVHLYTDHGIGQEPKCRHPDCAGRDIFTNYRVYERHIKTSHIPKDQVCPHSNCGKKYKGADTQWSYQVSTCREGDTAVCWMWQILCFQELTIHQQE